MLPHSLSTRPLIIKADSQIEVVIKEAKSNFSFDSHDNFTLEGKSKIKVSKAKAKL